MMDEAVVFEEYRAFKREFAGKIRLADRSSRSQRSLALWRQSLASLTAMARQGRLDPVIDRDDEITRCIEILSRSPSYPSENTSPLLLGEAGVGKTAIIAGLAQRIVQGDVPHALAGFELISLDIGALISMTNNPAEAGGFLNALTTESKVLVVLDDIHTVLAEGNAAPEARRLLRAMLTGRELRCIAATTPHEYQELVGDIPGLEKCFQVVHVEEPSITSTISILRGLRATFESSHGVQIADSALVDAAVFSHFYINDRYLPDRAIDLLDEAAAQLRIDEGEGKQQMEWLCLEHVTKPVNADKDKFGSAYHRDRVHGRLHLALLLLNACVQRQLILVKVRILFEYCRKMLFIVLPEQGGPKKEVFEVARAKKTKLLSDFMDGVDEQSYIKSLGDHLMGLLKSEETAEIVEKALQHMGNVFMVTVGKHPGDVCLFP